MKRRGIIALYSLGRKRSEKKIATMLTKVLPVAYLWLARQRSSSFFFAEPLSIAWRAISIASCGLSVLPPAMIASEEFIKTISRCGPFSPDKICFTISAFSSGDPPVKFSGLQVCNPKSSGWRRYSLISHLTNSQTFVSPVRVISSNPSPPWTTKAWRLPSCFRTLAICFNRWSHKRLSPGHALLPDL